MDLTDRYSIGVRDALQSLGIAISPSSVHFERPAHLEHGDFSTNVALVIAKAHNETPRGLAESLATILRTTDLPHVVAVEVAGPGFLNLRLDPKWLHDVLREVIGLGEENYGRPDVGQAERVQIEFVSANPTGPLHVGNGWLGSYGDALGRILSRCGFDVAREYYVNDTGNQIRVLGESLLARRRGENVSDDGYQGAYVTELAATYAGPEDVIEAGRYASSEILANIRATLDRLGIVFDEWYSQASIEESGVLNETIEILRSKGFVYEQDGATFFASSSLGDDRDRVLIKANGDPTYLAGDLAYHRDKFLVRKFDRVIDVFGADHHGQVASLRAGVLALGIDPDRLEVKLGQLVSLVGERMSKRTGNFVRLDELIDILGADATRLLSLLSSIDQAAVLDLDLVRKQSAENPVFYVQYAHARISSIERVRVDRNIFRAPIEQVDLTVLSNPRELDMLRRLAGLEAVLVDAASDRAPYKVTNWVRSLAGEFHGFYHDHRVLGDDVAPEETAARLWLVEGARIGLSIGLSLLGASAPEQM